MIGTAQLDQLPSSVEYAITKGLGDFRDEGERAIPITIEDPSGDRYGTLTDDEAVERSLRVTRIVIVVDRVSA